MSASIFQKLDRYYNSARMYGCDVIIREYLDIPASMPLPITIPHGIDYRHLKQDLDQHCFEPIYIAFRDDIARRVSAHKHVLRFPHPWLLLPDDDEQLAPRQGTLFIAPTPSEENFTALMRGVEAGDYEKPWGVLLKDRGLTKEDEDFWSSLGFRTHCAGSIHSDSFFKNLKSIFRDYAVVASPNMSSAVIFAVSSGLRAVAVPDVCLIAICVPGMATYVESDLSAARDVWMNLLSIDQDAARNQANELLGKPYLDSRENLRAKLFAAIESVKKTPIHLYPLRDGSLYRLAVWLTSLGFPIPKGFPTPIAKVSQKLKSLLGFNRLSVTRGCDFAYYGVIGTETVLQSETTYAFRLGKGAVPGRAPRNLS